MYSFHYLTLLLLLYIINIIIKYITLISLIIIFIKFTDNKELLLISLYNNVLLLSYMNNITYD